MSAHAEQRLRTRTAVAADLPALQRVYRAASLSNAGDAPKLLARPEFLVFTGEGVAAGRTLATVAGPPGGDRIVGFATLVENPDGGGELEDLFVDPSWRRQGIARRLVGQLVDRARSAGCRTVWVTGNPHALDFYTAVGFVLDGEISTALGTGLRMRLDV